MEGTHQEGGREGVTISLQAPVRVACLCLEEYSWGGFLQVDLRLKLSDSKKQIHICIYKRQVYKRYEPGFPGKFKIIIR